MSSTFQTHLDDQIDSIDQVLPKGRFPEDALGFTTHTARYTHRYVSRSSEESLREGIREFRRTHDVHPLPTSPDSSDYPRIVPNTSEDLESEAAWSPSIVPNLSDPHDTAQQPLPELTPSASKESIPCSPPGSSEQTYELPTKFDAPAAVKPFQLESVPLSSDDNAAPFPSRSLKEKEMLEARAVFHQPLQEPTSCASEDVPEEAEFVVVRYHVLTLDAKEDPATIKHIRAYKDFQAVFQAALAAFPVLLNDQSKFASLFRTDWQSQGVWISQHNIVKAAKIVHRSPAWRSEAKDELLHALSKTISHRKRVAQWYARLNANDRRNDGQESHQYIIKVLESAWEILNDGVEWDPRNTPTWIAAQSAA